MRPLSPATHLSGIVGGSRMNPDVRIENGVEMATRACNGIVDSGTRMKPRYTTQNGIFRGYKHPMRQKYAGNARETEKMGPDGPFFAIFRVFWRISNLTGRKTARKPCFEQGVPPYDPQLAGYAIPLARYAPIWYCRWVEGEP